MAREPGARAHVSRRADRVVPGPARDAGAAFVDRAEDPDSFRTTIAGLYRYRGLLRSLVAKDLKLKYRGSVLGFLWSLANPLMLIVVYTIAFRYILRIGNDRFVLLLILGVLAWTFFANSTLMATGAIVDNASLVKSVFFPRAILPAATVCFNLAQYVLTLFVFLPAMLAVFRVGPAAPMIVYPAFLALQVLFTMGVAMLIATGTAFYRDIRHFVEVALLLLFWLTPILYRLDQVPGRLRGVVFASPMSPFIVAYQRIFFDVRWPEPGVWILCLVYAAGAFALGSAVLLRLEDRLIEQV
jgi:homopolymeric O-antigen transport system permease protein